MVNSANLRLGAAWLLSAAAIAAPASASPAAPSGPLAAVMAGQPIFEARLRYEDVEQTGLAQHATAATLRTRLGWKTAPWRGFTALVEAEDVRRLGPEHYNVAVPGPAGGSINGKTAYPIINDPQTTELKRAQLTWTPSPALTLTGGRQRILLDDQRFLGDGGWRQDEQTFDAARADVTLGRLSATYAWLGRINRIFGEARDWGSRSSALNVTYAVADPIKLEGFVYALDFPNSKLNSSLTTGLRLRGKAASGKVAWVYGATWAREVPYGNQPDRFNLGYGQADAMATAGAYGLKLDYAVLEGDGVRGFFTPLGTPHAFQGWADAFAGVGGSKSFADGIKDFNVTAVWKPPLRLAVLSKPELTVRWHDFDAERTGAALGREWDLQAVASLTPKLSGLVKLAQFTRAGSVPPGGAPPPASRTKVWIGLEFKL